MVLGVSGVDSVVTTLPPFPPKTMVFEQKPVNLLSGILIAVNLLHPRVLMLTGTMEVPGIPGVMGSHGGNGGPEIPRLPLVLRIPGVLEFLITLTDCANVSKRSEAAKILF